MEEMEDIQEERPELVGNNDGPLQNLDADEDKEFNYAQTPSVDIVFDEDKYNLHTNIHSSFSPSPQDVQTKNLLGECIEDLPQTPNPNTNADQEDELLKITEAPYTAPEVDDVLLKVVTPVPPPSSWARVSLVTSLVTAWLVFLLYCYLTLTTVCSEVSLHCPAPGHTFTARACCSSLWLHLGAPVGLGNECSVDMAEMEAGCPMYSCYKNATTGELNVNGCTGVPNMLFNEAACNIHDLCYITPGASKQFCDETFVENIVSAYCDNVNVLERLSCTGRAQLAGAVVSAIDSFYDDSANTRGTCSLVSSWPTSLIATLIVTLIICATLARLLKPAREVQEKAVTFESKIEEILEEKVESFDENKELLQENTLVENMHHYEDPTNNQEIDHEESGENVTNSTPSECDTKYQDSDEDLIKEYQ